MAVAPLSSSTSSPTFLRSMTTVHARDMALVQTEQFWRDLLPTLTFLPHQTATGEFTERMQAVIERLNPQLRMKILSGTLLLLEDVDRPHPNECLISINPEASEVGIRIFGRYLTDIQSTSEWFLRRLLEAQEHFIITPHTRCFVILDVNGQRTELITGRVNPLRHKLWAGFYHEHIYAINITGAVLLFTLLVVILFVPDSPHSALGKFYGICERVLTAAMMNVFLLLGQFYAYRKGRHVVEWEKP